LIAAVSGCLLLLSLDEELPLTKVLLHPWLAGLGTISYGFYVLHALSLPMVTYWLSGLGLSMRAGVVFLTFVVITVVSLVSFVFFETKFLRFKALLAPRPRRGGRVSEQPGI